MVTADNKDGFFKKLFRHEGIEQAPKGFADKVMDTLEAEGSIVMEGRWSLRLAQGRLWSGWWLWGSVVFALACLVAAVFFVDFSFMGVLIEGLELDGSRITSFVQYSGYDLMQAYENFNFSSISITILIAIVTLILVERMLRRKTKIEMHIMYLVAGFWLLGVFPYIRKKIHAPFISHHRDFCLAIEKNR